jgi:hypothetical protein
MAAPGAVQGLQLPSREQLLAAGPDGGGDGSAEGAGGAPSHPPAAWGPGAGDKGCRNQGALPRRGRALSIKPHAHSQRPPVRPPCQSLPRRGGGWRCQRTSCMRASTATARVGRRRDLFCFTAGAGTGGGLAQASEAAPACTPPPGPCQHMCRGFRNPTRRPPPRRRGVRGSRAVRAAGRVKLRPRWAVARRGVRQPQLRAQRRGLRDWRPLGGRGGFFWWQGCARARKKAR